MMAKDGNFYDFARRTGESVITITGQNGLMVEEGGNSIGTTLVQGFWCRPKREISIYNESSRFSERPVPKRPISGMRGLRN